MRPALRRRPQGGTDEEDLRMPKRCSHEAGRFDVGCKEAPMKIYELNDHGEPSSPKIINLSPEELQEQLREEGADDPRLNDSTFTSSSDKTKVIKLYMDYRFKIRRKLSTLADKYETAVSGQPQRPYRSKALRDQRSGNKEYQCQRQHANKECSAGDNAEISLRAEDIEGYYCYMSGNRNDVYTSVR